MQFGPAHDGDDVTVNGAFIYVAQNGLLRYWTPQKTVAMSTVCDPNSWQPIKRLDPKGGEW